MKLRFLAIFGVCIAILGVLFALGEFRQAAPAQTPATAMEQYSSEDGVLFMYPDSYELSSTANAVGDFHWDSLTLIQKGYVPPQGGEGPVAISLSVFSNAEGLTLEQFIQNEPHSNYQLSSDGVLTPGTVGGEPSLSYQHSGLYENDAVAVAHGGKIFLFSASWMQSTDAIRDDFKKLIKSVTFTY